MKRIFWILPLLFAHLEAATAQRAQPLVAARLLEVRGDVMKPRAWNLAQLQKLAPVQTIKTTLKGQPFSARGVALWTLIEAAAPKLDAKTKHSEARFIVLARGKDGYLASFSYPELAPEVGNKGVFLIWEANGQPIVGSAGPLRLVVIGDKKPMRWVYGLAALEIYDAKRLSTLTIATP